MVDQIQQPRIEKQSGSVRVPLPVPTHKIQPVGRADESHVRSPRAVIAARSRLLSRTRIDSDRSKRTGGKVDPPKGVL
jgi:hypothetical protein